MVDDYPADFKYDIKVAILKRLYELPEMMLQTRLGKLIQACAELRDPRNSALDKVFSIYHQGKYYFNYELSNEVTQKVLIKGMHTTVDVYPEMEDEIYTTIHDLKRLEGEKNIVDVYLNQMLNVCNTLDDVYQLTPTILHDAIPYEIENPHTTVNPELARLHKLKNKESRDTMMERLVLNRFFKGA